MKVPTQSTKASRALIRPDLSELRCEVDCLTQGFYQTAFVSDTFSRNVESRAMVDGGSYDRQTDRDIHARFETKDLDRAMA